MTTGILLVIFGTWPPHVLSAVRCVSLILPLMLWCRPHVVDSSLKTEVVSTTPMWNTSCHISAWSSQIFTLLTLPFIHVLYLLQLDIFLSSWIMFIVPCLVPHSTVIGIHKMHLINLYLKHYSNKIYLAYIRLYEILL